MFDNVMGETLVCLCGMVGVLGFAGFVGTGWWMSRKWLAPRAGSDGTAASSMALWGRNHE
jgi:hypothetical protein